MFVVCKIGVGVGTGADASVSASSGANKLKTTCKTFLLHHDEADDLDL